MGILDWVTRRMGAVDPILEQPSPPVIQASRTEGSSLDSQEDEPRRLYQIDVQAEFGSAWVEVLSVQKGESGLTVDCLLAKTLDLTREIPVLLPAGRTSLIAARSVSGSGVVSELSEPWEIEPLEDDRLAVRQSHFQSLLDRVEYPDFKFVCGLSGEALYLQISCSGRCNVTGGDLDWKSGKWLLSEHMLDSEVVQKALKATLTAIEHEARELFKYRGRTIFDPHFDVDRLWELRGEPGAVVQRGPPGKETGPRVGPLESKLYSITGLPSPRRIAELSLSELYELETKTAPRAADCDNPGAVAIVANRNVQNRIRELGGIPRFNKFGNLIT